MAKGLAWIIVNSAADLRKLENQLQSVLREGQDMSCQLELGQAESPLSDHFARIQQSVVAAPFSISVLGVDADSRGATLAWLCGDSTRVLSVNVPKELGLVEVKLHEQGYILEKTDGSRQEFDRLDPFLSAMKSEDLLRSDDATSWVDPIRLSMAAPEGVQGLHLLMPESIDAVANSPALFNRMSESSNLLVLAAPCDYEFTPEDRELLSEIGESIDVLLPVAFSSGAEFSKRSWWSDRKIAGPAQLAPPVLIDQSDPKQEIPSFLLEAAHPLRKSLFLQQHARKLITAVRMVEARQESERQQLNARMARTARQTRALESENKSKDSRPAIEELKHNFKKDLTALIDGIGENNRQLLLPNGDWSSSIQSMLEELSAEDLIEERAPKVIKLSISEGFEHEMDCLLERLVSEQLREDLVYLRDGLEALSQAYSTKLAELNCAGPAPRLDCLDETQLAKRLKEMMAIELKYKGELPRRSFFQRLGEGRRPVFMIMMSLSLVGSAFGFSRTGPGMKLLWKALFVLFIVAFLYTYRSWKHEDVERVEKELEKLNDNIQREFSGRLTELQREKLQQIRDHVSVLERDQLRMMDSRFRDSQKEDSAKQTVDRTELQGRMRTFEMQTKDLQAHGQRIGRLRQSSSEFFSSCSRFLVASIRDYEKQAKAEDSK